MTHKRTGLARPCTANDLFLVSEGLQCGNCLAVETRDDTSERGICQEPARGVFPACDMYAVRGTTRCFKHRT